MLLPGLVRGKPSNNASLLGCYGLPSFVTQKSNHPASSNVALLALLAKPD